MFQPTYDKERKRIYPEFINELYSVADISSCMKAAVATIIGISLFVAGILGGMLLQVTLTNSQQMGSATHELLVIEDYISKPFSKQGIQFTIKNDGSGIVQIANVTVNGHANESIPGFEVGWNGTLVFNPNQTGLVWVYYPAYYETLKAEIPSTANQSSIEGLENLESWINSFNCTFSFVTSKGNEFNCTVPRPGYDIMAALSLSGVLNEPVQEENLFMTKQHIWFNTTGSWTEAAFVIVNTGGGDVVLDKVTVRGQESSWSNVYCWKTNNVTVSDDLLVTPVPLTGAAFNITVQGSARSFSLATENITLKSGYMMVVYISNPGSIGLNDMGLPVGITVFTENAQYYKETVVQAVQ